MKTTSGTSSAPPLSVDTEALTGWANDLRGCVEPLGALARSETRWSVVAPSGDCAVDGALGSFMEAWGHASGAVLDDLTRLADAIGSVARLFESSEAMIAQQLRPGCEPS